MLTANRRSSSSASVVDRRNIMERLDEPANTSQQPSPTHQPSPPHQHNAAASAQIQAIVEDKDAKLDSMLEAFLREESAYDRKGEYKNRNSYGRSHSLAGPVDEYSDRVKSTPGKKSCLIA